MESKISTQNLQLNMFVSRLDRPWLGTPFPIEGVWIQDQATISLLQQHCQYVFIRTDRVRQAIASDPERAKVKRAQNAVLDRLLSPGGSPLAPPISRCLRQAVFRHQEGPSVALWNFGPRNPRFTKTGQRMKKNIAAHTVCGANYANR